MKKFTVILFLLYPSIFFCQWEQKIDSLNIEIGTSFEYSILFFKQNYNDEKHTRYLSETFPFSFYLFLMLNSKKDFGFKLKPGLVFANNELKAIDLGFHFYHYFLEHKYIGMIGLNIHTNISASDHSRSPFDGNAYFLSTMVGFNTSDFIVFTLGYYMRLSQNPYYNRYNEISGPVYLNHIVKFGVEFIF